MTSPRVRMLIASALAVALLDSTAALAAVGRAGTTAANFLSVGSDAGIMGMGGAGLGLGGGLGAAAWNPASLSQVGPAEIVVSHSGLAEQSAQEWLALGGSLGFAGLHGALTGLFQGDGMIDGRDALNNATGSFDVSSSAFGLGLARNLGAAVTAGVGLKFANEKLASVSGSGVAFDAGIALRAGAFGVGAAAQNAFGGMSYDGARYPCPANYGVGVSYTHAASGMRMALDANFPYAYYSDVRGGVEWRWSDRVALRTGYRAELGAAARDPLSGPTFGLGAGARGVWLDYGYLLGGNGEGQHRVAIAIHPSAMGWSAREAMRDAGVSSSVASNPAFASHALPAPGSAEIPRVPTPVRAAHAAPIAAATNLPGPGLGPALDTVARARAAAAAGASAPTAVARPEPVAAPRPKSAPGAGTTATSRATLAVDSSAAGRVGAAHLADSTAAAAPLRADSLASASKSSSPRITVSPARATARSKPVKVRVNKGETLNDIALAHGTTAAAIMMENNLTSERVHSGQVLRLPAK